MGWVFPHLLTIKNPYRHASQATCSRSFLLRLSFQVILGWVKLRAKRDQHIQQGVSQSLNEYCATSCPYWL